MLTQDQITGTWERQIAAEVRALYFADLATRYTQQKQWISGISLFLASGATGALLGKLPTWLPLILSAITAVLSAYTIARGLDASARTMSKFQFAWSELATGFEALWNNVYDEGAAARFAQLVAKENELSSQATTEAPNDQVRLGYWQDQVLKQHHLAAA